MQRLEFILRRLLTSIFVLLGVSFITFFIARVVPNDAAAMYIGPKARQADIDRVTKQLGLDKPLPAQYVIYMQELLRGDLGTSISTKRPVLQELTGRLPATLELLLFGMFIAAIVGVPLGVLSAQSQGKLPDVAVRALSIVGVSMPAFFLRTHPSNYFLSQPRSSSICGARGCGPAIYGSADEDHGFHPARFFPDLELGHPQGCFSTPHPSRRHPVRLPDGLSSPA